MRWLSLLLLLWPTAALAQTEKPAGDSPPAPAQPSTAPPAEESPTPGADEPAPESGPKVVSASREGMATRLQVLIWTEDEAGARAAIEAGFAEMDRIEALMSEWKPESDVSKINGSAGKKKPIEISKETHAVLSRGKDVWSASEGAFAMTWAALASLWNFEAKKVPDPGKAIDRVGLVGDGALELGTEGEAPTARLPKEGMALGLGGIAKGYAIDRALDVITAKGFTDVLVFAGGDIVVRGSKGKRPWLVGIQDPRAVGYFATVPVKDEAVVTSGDYERFFDLGSTRYHHILDPRTGFPARKSRSVTVLAKDGLTADAYSTAVFVLGAEKGLALVEKTKGVEAIIVDDKNKVTLSTGLRERVRVIREPSE